MAIDKISIRKIKNMDTLSIEFDFPESNIIVITGKNGIGKTTIVKSFNLLDDPNIFAKSSGENALGDNSRVSFAIEGVRPFEFSYNAKLGAMDSKDLLPSENTIISELPIPYGARFRRFSKIAGFDSELKVNIASSDYERACDLIDFFSRVYLSEKFSELKSTRIKKDTFYFLLKEDDYYIREDHFSSGEFFLIQLYRLVTSGARLILIDELDVALDAVAQVNLFAAIKPILEANNSRLIVVSHSLAFMSTVDEGGLYYLEKSSGKITLESRSFGYIKSDLFALRGYDRYILTEDPVLEGFIEFVIRSSSVSCHYQHLTIGVGGDNQLKMIVEKNDSEQIFSNSKNVRCVVDGDVFDTLSASYVGPTHIIRSPVDDLEKYIYLNRDTLLNTVERPDYTESKDPKRASKTYWKWLVNDRGVDSRRLYELVAESEPEKMKLFLVEIETFLGK